MSIAVYIRKEYFRAVTIKDKSAHILEFQYRPQTVDVLDRKSTRLNSSHGAKSRMPSSA